MDVPRARAGGMAGGFFAIYVRTLPGTNPPEPTPDERGHWTWKPPAIDHAHAASDTATLLDDIDAVFQRHGDVLQQCLTHDDLVNCLHVTASACCCTTLTTQRPSRARTSRG